MCAPSCHPDLYRIVDHIVEHFAPRRVLFFGAPRQCLLAPQNDTALLVIVDRPPGEARVAQSANSSPRLVNLVFQTPEEVRAALAKSHSAWAHVLRNSPRLYPRSKRECP